MESYFLKQYTIDNLKEILSDHDYSASHLIEDKTHLIYFNDYFSDLGVGAQTMIVENRYIDRDYLEDFSGYYIRCFEDYERSCRRIHFFDQRITDDEFKEYIKGKTTDELQDAYIGFVTVRPLPKTIIGRTCLSTYKDDDRRKYPATRTYSVNLFGLSLKVDNTLAFQEQDRVASACATSALWSVFQATGKLFEHSIPSPVVITESATKQIPLDSRSLPNNGLTAEQMAYAVREVGLEPLSISARGNTGLLKAQLYAYLKSGIPLIMIIDLYETKALPSLSRFGNERHAVAVTGFSLGTPIPIQYSQHSKLLLKSSRIDKLYVHDDQVGPFARMEFKNVNVKQRDLTGEDTNEEIPLTVLDSSLRDVEGSVGDIFTIWDTVYVPLYHKIRIPFQSVLLNAIYIDGFINEILTKNKFLNLADRLVWDVYLITVNDLKNEIRENSILHEDKRIELLLTNFPKYIWRASSYSGDNQVLDLLFDATDIEQGSYFERPILYNDDVEIVMTAACEGINISSLSKKIPDSVIGIIDWFKNNKTK